MSDRDQTDATLLRCALRQCERERDAARENVDRLAKELCNARRERDEMIDAANNARRDRDAWCRIAAGARPPKIEALTAAHRETIRGAAEYLRNMGDFRMACELLDILTTAGEAKDAPPVARHGTAPEHVQTLKELSALHDGWTEATCAIRAALAALGEEAT